MQMRTLKPSLSMLLSYGTESTFTPMIVFRSVASFPRKKATRNLRVAQNRRAPAHPRDELRETSALGGIHLKQGTGNVAITINIIGTGVLRRANGSHRTDDI